MCASYMIKQRHPGVFELLTSARFDVGEVIDRLIVPYAPAPVLLANGDGTDIEMMKFSMVPAWSPTPKVKFATHNARLETLAVKPTWRGVLGKRHCLVVLTDFIEPIYSGEFAGNMVAFSASNGRLLFAAGLWDEWTGPDGQSFRSFAIITHDPPPVIETMGHDRCPIFLDEDAGQEWLTAANTPAPELEDFLLDAKQTPDYHAEKFRALKAGWEKRK